MCLRIIPEAVVERVSSDSLASNQTCPLTQTCGQAVLLPVEDMILSIHPIRVD